MTTKIIIEIESTGSSAKVSQTGDNKRTVVKNIPISDLPELIKVSSTNTVKDSDTGYISPNLIREVIAHGQMKRLYHFPTIKFNCNLNIEGYLSCDPDDDDDDCYYPDINTENKYGITIKDEHLVIPNFIYRDFGLLIVNVNNDTFSCVRHNFGCITTDFFGHVSDESNLNFALLNHFDQKVCWHGSFDYTLLAERDSVKQARLVHNYLNSNFNNDLHLRQRPTEDTIKKYSSEGLLDFFKEIFGDDHGERMLHADSDGYRYFISILIIYYLSTHLGLKFEEICEHSCDYGDSSLLRLREYF